MGKKAKREREEKRDSFAAKRSQQKRKNVAIAAAILGTVAIIVGYSAYTFATFGANAPGAPDGAGILGDEHEHAAILVKIFGDNFDFSLPAYQIKSSWIHFEAQDGTTVHRHASGVELEFLFNSLNIALSDECFVFPDGRQFCTNEDYSLKYYVNHQQVPSINEYVFEDQDRILITYGDETADEIEAQLAELDSQPILG